MSKQLNNFLISLIWGTSIAFINMVSQKIMPFSLTLIRFSISFLFLSFFIIIQKHNIFALKYRTREFWEIVIKGAVFYFIYSCLYHSAARFLPIVNMSAFCCLTPLFSLIIYNLTTGKLVSFKQCMLIAGAGIGAVAMIDSVNLRSHSIYYIGMLIAIVLWCIYYLNYPSSKTDYSNIVIGFYQTLIISLFALPFYFTEKNLYSLLTPLDFAAIFFISVICIAFGLYIINKPYTQLNKYSDIVLFYCRASIITLCLYCIIERHLPSIHGWIGLSIIIITLIISIVDIYSYDCNSIQESD